MNLSGLHLLLTYQCTFECDHCFVWGSPFQSGVISLNQVRQILQQAQDLGTVSSIYFEGGEPFLYYPTLLSAVKEAATQGFDVGIVSNAYWATSEEDALAALKPFAGYLQDLTVSSDLFHWDEPDSQPVSCALWAANLLGIPTGAITIARPQDQSAATKAGMLAPGESGVMYRGRAAVVLAGSVPHHPWDGFTECPYEELLEPERVHIDPLGNVHLCQGIVLGNLFETHLAQICAGYQPEHHPVVGPLLSGGPAELARRYGLNPDSGYADACHLCYETRQQLRGQMPEILGPDQMYGGGV